MYSIAYGKNTIATGNKIVIQRGKPTRTNIITLSYFYPMDNKLYHLLTISLLLLIFSCSNQSPKIEDSNQLGQTILELFKKGDSKKITNYLITKDEVKKAFENSIATTSFSEKDRDQFFTDIYERNRKDALRFIDLYTSETYTKEGVLKNAVYENTTSQLKEENGTVVSRIITSFSSGNHKYQLVLDAAKVANYWKLLSWIEIRKGY